MPAIPYYGHMVTPPPYYGAHPYAAYPAHPPQPSYNPYGMPYPHMAPPHAPPPQHHKLPGVVDAMPAFVAHQQPAMPYDASVRYQQQLPQQPQAYAPYPTHCHTAFSSNGTTFFVPSGPVPLDQMGPAGAPVAPVAPVAAPSERQHAPPTTGGVAATLDYDMDHMADFLSTMALGVMAPTPGAWDPKAVAAYTKFVCQVLTATRLPRVTIILALVYLSKRWALPNLPDVRADENARYKMLVVALLLSNKFNDDNTFTNKSWFEATGIPVADLTKVEAHWLREIKWSLYVSESDRKGWDKWNHCWRVYMSSRTPATPSPSSSGTLSPASPASTASSHSPGRPTYTVPKWYESNGPLATHRAAEPFVSYFQQSFAPPLHRAAAYDEEKAVGYMPARPNHMHAPPSFYMAAYNHVASCTCTLCVPDAQAQVLPAPWYTGSSVVAC